MNLSAAYDFLNFWINKVQGGYYSPPELDNIVDGAQMAIFNELRSEYATSQRIHDALAPFIATYNFTPSNTLSGYIIVPSTPEYLGLIDIQVSFGVSNRTVYAGVPILGKDERANRLNSQLNPVTVTSPVAEVTAPRYFRIYPISGYTGTVTYFRRPVAPVYGYSIVSGRVVVYNANTSTQLEWGQEWVTPILLKALSSIGINLRDAEVQQYAEMKNQNNFLNQNNT